MMLSIVTSVAVGEAPRKWGLWSTLNEELVTLDVTVTDSNNVWARRGICKASHNGNTISDDEWSKCFRDVLQPALQPALFPPSKAADFKYQLQASEGSDAIVLTISEKLKFNTATLWKEVLTCSLARDARPDARFDLLGIISASMAERQKREDILTRQVTEAHTALATMGIQLDKAAAEKDTAMDDIIRKMVLLLNTKKREIKKLQGKGKSGASGHDTPPLASSDDDDDAGNKPSNRGNSPPRPRDDDSDDEAETIGVNGAAGRGPTSFSSSSSSSSSSSVSNLQTKKRGAGAISKSKSAANGSNGAAAAGGGPGKPPSENLGTLLSNHIKVVDGSAYTQAGGSQFARIAPVPAPAQAPAAAAAATTSVSATAGTGKRKGKFSVSNSDDEMDMLLT